MYILKSVFLNKLGKKEKFSSLILVSNNKEAIIDTVY